VHRVIIIGGGPIGLTCAALLARRHIGSCLIDARPLEQARLDPRLLALSRGSWEILTPVLGANLPPRAAIREVRVSSAGEFGATRISATDLDGADLGATVHYGDLVAALAEAVATQPQIEILRPMTAGEIRQRPDRVEVTLADGSARDADIVINAEGFDARAGGAAATEHWALIADLRLLPADDLPAGTAIERFTREGPLALLPTPRPFGSGSGTTFSLVWCMGRQQAQRRGGLDDPALIGELHAMLGPRLGRVVAAGPRRALALPRRLNERVHEHRVVALGNAAQTLHPVAGQGFNLGLRDCATLADELAQAVDATDALARYARRRQADRKSIALLTDGLPAVFASRFAPLALARSLGLALLDTAPPLRREFAQLLMFGVRR
jgi:2-octaprenyl-6-methoxyphenol hydroxylase